MENFPVVEKSFSGRGINSEEKAENPCEEVEKKSNNPMRPASADAIVFPILFQRFSRLSPRRYPPVFLRVAPLSQTHPEAGIRKAAAVGTVAEKVNL